MSKDSVQVVHQLLWCLTEDYDVIEIADAANIQEIVKDDLPSLRVSSVTLRRTNFFQIISHRTAEVTPPRQPYSVSITT